MIKKEFENDEFPPSVLPGPESVNLARRVLWVNTRGDVERKALSFDSNSKLKIFVLSTLHYKLVQCRVKIFRNN